MTLQEIISKWESKRNDESNKFAMFDTDCDIDQKIATRYAIKSNIISEVLEDLKKLNEAAVSEENKCIHAICSKDSCPFFRYDNVICPLGE